jgi:hypothetical protein
MGLPAISYRTTVNDFYEYGFYRLPNLLSHQCFGFEELSITLGKILAGELGAADGAERKAIIKHHLAAGEGPLACARIIDVLEQITQRRSELPKPALLDQFGDWCTANGRRLIKRAKTYFPSSHNRPKFQRHRYLDIRLEELRVQQLYFHIFRISA